MAEVRFSAFTMRIGAILSMCNNAKYESVTESETNEMILRLNEPDLSADMLCSSRFCF